MSEIDKNVSEDTTIDKDTTMDKNPSKPVHKTQSQILQEALGLKPEEIQKVEKKLFIVRFLDYFSEEALDFIYKNQTIEMYKLDIQKFFDTLNTIGNEEDKLLIKQFADKKVMDAVYQIKNKAEDKALKKGNIKEPVDKKLRKLSLLITLPLFLILIILTFVLMNYITNFIWYIIPLMCVFCMAPQFVRAKILRRWYQFKEENRTEFYTENRNDILILKSYAGEILNNIRSNLLELKVPLQIIKFVLHSRDYENLKLISQNVIRGVPQFFFSFEYPSGMEPFPIPKMLLDQYQQSPTELKESIKSEKNFIILTEMKSKNGTIEHYLPRLKIDLASDINKMLNDCEFNPTLKSINEIIPNFDKLPIYCVCGELADFSNIQICNWKNEFKFYLFESKECKCGQKIYVLSLIDEDDNIPSEFKTIFSN